MKKLGILILAWVICMSLVAWCSGDTIVTGDEDSKVTSLTASTTINKSHFGSKGNKAIINNTGAGGSITLTLPKCVATKVNPMIITVFLTVAQAIVIDPNGTEQIITLTNGAGDSITNSGTLSDWVTLGCLTTGYWHRLGINGTWSDTN